MRLYELSNCKGGWVVGDFDPAVIHSKEVEVAIKRYKQNDYDNSHYHKEADEITIIVSGTVKMNDQIYHEDQVIWIEKNEVTDFLALTDAVTCVIKLPSVIGDKYLV